jgi:hypothetical protein
MNDINEPNYELVDKGYYFKFFNPTTDIKLIRVFLEQNGFLELNVSQGSHKLGAQSAKSSLSRKQNSLS